MIIKTIEICFSGIIVMVSITVMAIFVLVLRRIVDEICHRDWSG